MSGDRNIDFVLRTVEKRDVRFIRLWFTDVLGNLKSFSISSEDLEEAFEEGVGFDGSSVAGFVSQDESDMLAFPDATTFQVLPWRPEKCGVARMFCDIRTPSRELFEGDTRSVLTRVFTAADEKGYVMNVGPKLEYFYFDQEKAPTPVPLDHAGYFDLTSSDSAMDLRRETTLSLEHMSIPVTYSYHSSAPSQNGIELRYSEAVTCADNIMTSRLVIRQLAHEHGMMASFMPKPFTGASGSGMFLYQSLFDHDGNNLFWGPQDRAPRAPLAPGLALRGGTPQVCPRVHAGHQSHRELLQAPRLQRRGSRVRHLGPQEPLRAGAHTHPQAGQAPGHQGRAPQPRPHGQPLPGPRGLARGRHPRHRGGARTSRGVLLGLRAPRRRRAGEQGLPSPAEDPGRRNQALRQERAHARDPGRPHLRLPCRPEVARVGRVQRHGHRVGEKELLRGPVGAQTGSHDPCAGRRPRLGRRCRSVPHRRSNCLSHPALFRQIKISYPQLCNFGN
ncbi:glutamine synthetase, beta-grasp domain protein [Olsenella sp. DNF00959]|nr:glutamine synthetase, beta-grasp domain protein [Olsenella sp. DNF00959]